MDPEGAPNIIDNKNPKYRELHCTMDSYFHSLRVEGVGAEVKHASTISKDEENQFWEQGVFVSVHPFGIAMSCFIAMERFFVCVE